MITIPIFNFIILILTLIAFMIFIFVNAYKMGEAKMYRKFYSDLLKHSDEKIMSIVKTLRLIK